MLTSSTITETEPREPDTYGLSPMSAAIVFQHPAFDSSALELPVVSDKLIGARLLKKKATFTPFDRPPLHPFLVIQTIESVSRYAAESGVHPRAPSGAYKSSLVHFTVHTHRTKPIKRPSESNSHDNYDSMRWRYEVRRVLHAEVSRCPSWVF